MSESPLSGARQVVRINLNDSAVFRLTEKGRKVWRKHCRERNTFLAARLMDFKPEHTGEETELRLQFWAFIGAFGSPGLWGLGTEPVCEMTIDVNVEASL